MKRVFYGVAFGLGLAASPAAANEFAAALTDLAGSDIRAIAQSADIVAAVKAQNAETGAFDQAKIDQLDQDWRAEVDNADQPMISSILSRPASQWLAEKREASDGLFTEIFVMDAKGLNVAQSDPTSDYWQGDEAKWQETFLAGPEALHLSDVEEDESTQTFQSQVSVPVTDPDSNTVIGAITVGVNVELLP